MYKYSEKNDVITIERNNIKMEVLVSDNSLQLDCKQLHYTYKTKNDDKGFNSLLLNIDHISREMQIPRYFILEEELPEILEDDLN